MSKARIQLTSPVKGYLDIKEDFSVPLNFSVGDIRDISKRNGSYSRTITLIGNTNNNRLLGYLFDVNISTSSFNINTLQECIVEEDGVVILDNMYLQLTSIKKIQETGSYEEFVEYECEIKDSASDFFTKAQNLELTDLNMSAFNHIYSVGSITQSFDNTWVDGYKYVVPYLNNSNSYIIQDLKPGIYNRIYWDKIFDNTGYTYTFEEQDNLDIRFNKLIIPYNGDKPKPANDSEDWVIAEMVTNVPVTYTDTDTGMPKQETIFDTEIQDPFNNYNPVTGEYTLGYDVMNPDSIQYDFEIIFDVVITNNHAYTVSLQGPGDGVDYTNKYHLEQVNGLNSPIIEYGARLHVPKDTVLTTGQSYTIVTGYSEKVTCKISDLIATNKVESFINIRRMGTNGGQLQTWKNLGGVNQVIDISLTITSFKVTIKPSLDQFIQGSTLTMNSFIPKKIKQSDYIKAICQMYNLYIDIDKDNITNLIIKTRDRFYDEGVVVDWTYKLIKNNEQIIKFLPDLGNKKMVLTYKDDKDTLNSNYKNIINETYGQIEYVFENEYVRDVKRQELLFSPTPMLDTVFQANVPGIVGQAPNCNIRILLDNGVKDCLEWTINSTQSSATTLTTYPFISHFNDAENPTFDINYGICDFYFYSPDSLDGVEFNNLTYLHWIRTLNQINNGKLLSAMFDLNSNDIAKLKLNDKIRIDNSYWNINKVIDYDANSNNLTRVELISIDDDLELPTFRRTTTYQPVNGDIEFTDKGDIKNGVGKNRDHYTNIDMSNGKMKISGQQNQTNNLGEGYIDGDNNLYQGTGYTEIKGSGNTSSSASLLWANNNIVDENLVKVFSFVDDYHATQSNIFVIPNDLWIIGPTPSINGIPFPSGLQEDLEETLSIGNTTGTYSIILTDGVSIGGGLDPNGVPTLNILNLGDANAANYTWYLGDRDANTSEIRFDGTNAHFENGVGYTRINGADVYIDTSGEIFIVNTPGFGSTSSNVLLREPTGEVRISAFTENDLADAIGATALGWPGVLAINNTSGANDVIISSPQVVKSDTTTSEIQMNYGFSGGLLISNDNSGYTKGVLYMEDGFFGGLTELSNYAGSVYSFSTTETDISNNSNQMYLSDAVVSLWRTTGAGDEGRLLFYNGLGFPAGDMYADGTDAQIRVGISSLCNEIFIKENGTNPAVSGNISNNAVFIGSDSSTIDTGVINSVVIGGGFHSMSSSNSVIVGGLVNVIDATSDRVFIGGGDSGSILGTSLRSSLMGGANNTITDHINGTIIGGVGSTIGTGSNSGIFVGNTHVINTASINSAIIGGIGNDLNATESIILGGEDNSMTDSGGSDTYYNVIAGGFQNNINDSDTCGILSGESNTITDSTYSAIAGGIGNTINNATNTFIASGGNITATYNNTIYHMDKYVRNLHTIQTTDATVTTIHSFTPDTDGVFIVEYKVTANRPSNNTSLGDRVFGVFQVVAGAVTQIGTTTNDRKTTLPTLLPNVNVTLDTDGTLIRVRANGAAGLTINWTAALDLNR